MSDPVDAPFHPPAQTLFGPWADVLLLGAGSLIAMIVLRVLHPGLDTIAQMAIVGLVLANFVNHPHFAYSYQIFYGSWSEVRAGRMAPDLRRRWWLAGGIIPCVLALGLTGCAWAASQGNFKPMAVALIMMSILVGWHYVKQGFGMAMVDAALKKCYWPPATRRALLINAYVCWGAAWTVAASMTTVNSQYWGMTSIRLEIPPLLVTGACVLAAATTIWCTLHLVRCWRQWQEKGLRWRQLPVAGLVAYVTTLYFWLGLLSQEPAFAVFIPLFHSLQYLTVVARYKANEAKRIAGVSLISFASNGVLLGAAGFWLLPGLADFIHTGKIPRFDGAPYFFIAAFWIFINVHHYFIDNVLWRQGNPKVKQFLFDSPPPPARQAA